MVHKDTALLKFLLADSLTFIHSSGVIDNKISLLKDIGSGRITYMFIIPEKLTATVDGNYAWIFGRANVRFKLAVMTSVIDQYISFVEVYRLYKNQWQMILCQNARIENNAPYYQQYGAAGKKWVHSLHILKLKKKTAKHLYKGEAIGFMIVTSGL